MKSAVILSCAVLVACGDACGAAVSVDFSCTGARIKPLHGVNRAPMRLEHKGSSDGRDSQKEFAEAGIPFVRLHDVGGAWGGTHYVDIPNVFPNFAADENDPANYDFVFTDAFLKPIVKAGCRLVYRLGVTIENNCDIKAYTTHPPPDFAKWARICEHVVMHYNEGWANGFRWGIEYWEIWNEPEGRGNWRGTKREFFDLYRIAANQLKRRFPKIKVGGYGALGFYAVDQPDHPRYGVNGRMNTTKFAEEFMEYITNPATKAPLDFFSWHLYVRNGFKPDRIVVHAAHCRTMLDRHGFTSAESIFDEWNFIDDINIDAKWPKDWDGVKEIKSAASVAAAFALMQRAPIDKAMYYCALPTSGYCGLFYFPSMRTTPCYEAFRIWNILYQLGGEARVECSGEDIYAAAATDGTNGTFYVVNNSVVARNLDVRVNGMSEPFAVRRLDENHRALSYVGEWKMGEPLSLPPRGIAVLSGVH